MGILAQRASDRSRDTRYRTCQRTVALCNGHSGSHIDAITSTIDGETYDEWKRLRRKRYPGRPARMQSMCPNQARDASQEVGSVESAGREWARRDTHLTNKGPVSMPLHMQESVIGDTRELMDNARTGGQNRSNDRSNASAGLSRPPPLTPI